VLHSEPSAGGIGAPIPDFESRLANAGFVFVIGVMIVVSQAAKNAKTIRQEMLENGGLHDQ
jgi:hypothetical protein